jgi:hypothetical protein
VRRFSNNGRVGEKLAGKAAYGEQETLAILCSIACSQPGRQIGRALVLFHHLEWLEKMGSLMGLKAIISPLILWWLNHPIILGFLLMTCTFCGIMLHAYSAARKEQMEGHRDNKNDAVIIGKCLRRELL